MKKYLFGIGISILSVPILTVIKSSALQAKASPVLCKLSAHSAYNDKTVQRQLVFEDGDDGKKASIEIDHTELESKLDYIVFLNQEKNFFRVNAGGKWPNSNGAVHWVESLLLLGGRETYIAFGEQLIPGSEKPIEISITCAYR